VKNLKLVCCVPVVGFGILITAYALSLDEPVHTTQHQSPGIAEVDTLAAPIVDSMFTRCRPEGLCLPTASGQRLRLFAGKAVRIGIVGWTGAIRRT